MAAFFWHDRGLFFGAGYRDGLAPVRGLDRRSMNSVLLSVIPVSLALRYLLDVQPIWGFVVGAAAIGVLAGLGAPGDRAGFADPPLEGRSMSRSPLPGY